MNAGTNVHARSKDQEDWLTKGPGCGFALLPQLTNRALRGVQNVSGLGTGGELFTPVAL